MLVRLVGIYTVLPLQELPTKMRGVAMPRVARATLLLRLQRRRSKTGQARAPDGLQQFATFP